MSSIFIDKELNFKVHTALVGKIRRTLTFLDGAEKLFTSLVRLHLEYEQSVWSPYLMKHINMIERVQEPATKLVDGIVILGYSQRLEKLCLKRGREGCKRDARGIQEESSYERIGRILNELL